LPDLPDVLARTTLRRWVYVKLVGWASRLRLPAIDDKFLINQV
jgi:hypothetical protein